jgi:hypothetical protein
MGWVVNATPRPIYPRKWLGAHCIGGWVDPRAGVDGCGKSRLHSDIRFPDRPAQNAVTPTGNVARSTKVPHLRSQLCEKVRTFLPSVSRFTPTRPPFERLPSPDLYRFFASRVAPVFHLFRSSSSSSYSSRALSIWPWLSL